jgi:hypothetical protein
MASSDRTELGISRATVNTALAFALCDPVTGARLGSALICADVRYASIAWRGRDGLERRFVNPVDWQMFDLAVKLGFEPGPLSPEHIVPCILLDEEQRRNTAVEYLSSRQIDLAPASPAAILESTPPGDGDEDEARIKTATSTT